MANPARRGRVAKRQALLRFGVALALLVVLFDQLTKWWALGTLGEPPRLIEVTSFLNFVMVWNRGISFGLMAGDSSVAPWLFVAIAGAVAGGIVFWLARLTRRWIAAALGLVLGGAIGNLIDRLRFQAVIDFLDLHAADYHWPAFNLADASISAGVVFLAMDALLSPWKRLK